MCLACACPSNHDGFTAIIRRVRAGSDVANSPPLAATMRDVQEPARLVTDDGIATSTVRRRYIFRQKTDKHIETTACPAKLSLCQLTGLTILNKCDYFKIPTGCNVRVVCSHTVMNTCCM